ncbi:shikimate kinase [uncultured Sunxiuqinia sp.]|uniref:shikimate kinase n=1 Tax=uncultured Sunxiuqinia sp. TaxID=1573825 RepID=UPI002AA6B193|nr:shikimate kinase [uncultured Sunxiuqinia sp.]
MKIFLIGYMASGKSTIGRRLSQELGVPFIDLDKYIEEKYFKTIPQIFEQEGEDAFRRKEQTSLKEVAEFESAVIATGGGAPCFFDNMDVMNQSGLCVFLDVDAEELASRLMQSKTERPLIKGKSPDELVDFIESMMAKRRPFYEKAKCVLKGKDIQAEDVVAEMEGEK